MEVMSACNFLYPSLDPSCKVNFKGKTGIAFLYSELFCFFTQEEREKSLFARFQLLAGPCSGISVCLCPGMAKRE